MPITTFRVRILIPLLLIFLPASGEFLIQSNPIQISHNQAEMVFPGPITFSLNVAAGAPIQLVSLRYGTVGRTCAPAVYHENMKFSPVSVLELSWSWNLQNQGQYLPPGAQVWWQWLIHTSDEQSQLTERQVMTVEDPDHPWKSLESDAIHLEWFDGDPAFGQMLLNTALQSRARLASETGLLTPEQLTLLVYPDGVSFQSATLDLPEWTGGVAFPEYDTVLAAIGPEPDRLGQTCDPSRNRPSGDRSPGV